MTTNSKPSTNCKSNHPSKNCFLNHKCRCDECIAIWRAYYDANAEKLRARSLQWKLDNPEKHNEGKRRRYWADPERHRARGRAYAAEHRDQARARAQRAYYADPKKHLIYSANRRALKRNAEGKITPEIVARLEAVFGRKCLACGATEDMHLDHIQPLSKGGSNLIDNLQFLCRGCNLSKKVRTIDYRPPHLVAVLDNQLETLN